MISSEKIEPAYVVDTEALIYYLKEEKKLGGQARNIFQAAVRGETALIISAIVVAEMYYADQKRKLFDDFEATYDELKAQPYFHFVGFVADDVRDFRDDAAIPEMHDRIIAGLARRLNIPLVARDPEIVNSGLVRIAW